MRRVYADKSLGYDPERDFDRPVSMQETTHRHAASRGGSENEESVETSTTNNEATEPVKKAKSKSAAEKYFEQERAETSRYDCAVMRAYLIGSDAFNFINE